MKSRCPKLYDKTSQIRQLANVTYASEGHVPSSFRECTYGR